MQFLSAIFVLQFLYFSASFSSLAQKKLSLPVVKHKTVVIAHRGDHTASPENTLAAYQHAIDAGADYVEIDLRTTKDGKLVIMHDAIVDRMTNGHGQVKNMLWDSLQSLSVMNKQHPEWGTEKIPTFGEVLALCKGRIHIYLDFKDAAAGQAWQEIKMAGMEKSIVVYINAAPQIPAWRNVAPQVPLMISMPSPRTDAASVKKLLDSAAIDILDGSWDEYTKETVLAASRSGVPVWADMQSNQEGEETWEKGIALDLAGMQTDHPSRLIAFLIAKGRR